MIKDNLALVRKMEEALFNHRDPTAVDRYVSPAYTLRTAEAGAPSGREAIKSYIAAYLGGFPDLHISIEQIAIYRLEGGQVVDEWEISDQLGLMQQIGARAG